MFSLRSGVCMAVVAAVNIIYFVLMSKRLNLHLGWLLAYSLLATAICVFVTFKWFNLWTPVGALICVLYDLGITVHLINGKRYVKDVLA